MNLQKKKESAYAMMNQDSTNPEILREKERQSGREIPPLNDPGRVDPINLVE